MNRLLPLSALAVTGALLLSGCTDSSGGDGGKPTVVASTDVYGSVAQAVGGSRIDVVSIIDSPAKDPHEYEASARDRLAVSDATVVVQNGGGYDPFMEALLSSGAKDVVVLDAVKLSGLEASGSDEFNEHVWYDLPTVQKVADALAEALATADPAGADDYRANAKTFDAGLAALETRVGAVKTEVAGEQVAITEPVPLYLLDALGLENVTPADFSEAVEEDTDVAPDVLEQVLGLLDGRHARLLAYNDQTATAQTERVRTAAEQGGVPVVDFTETLPAKTDYLDWMTGNVDAVAAALGA